MITRASRIFPNRLFGSAIARSFSQVTIEELKAKSLAEVKKLFPEQVIDGTAISKQIKLEVKEQAEFLNKEFSITPGLAVVLVGNKPDSASYVRSKKKSANEAGFHSVDVHLEEDVTESELLSLVDKLNKDSKIHGILVQLPLPNHINEANILSKIQVNKDVDGFSAENIGNLCLKGGVPPLAVPCTPAGCIELLQRGVSASSSFYRGKRATVIGRSNIVGMPMAQVLLSLDCTVTTLHSKTSHTDLMEILGSSDIVVSAVGKPEFIRAEWLKPGSIVIDVGISSIDAPDTKKGYKLVGDVEFRESLLKGIKITPVPGGVGPMTIAMLLMNTINLARNSVGLERIHLRKDKYSN